MRLPLLQLFLFVCLAAFGQSPKFDAGLALYREGRLTEAIQEFKLSEKNGEEKALRAFYYGVSLAKLGQWSAAADRLRAYVAAQPRDPHGWYWLSRTQLLQKQFPDAHASVSRAIDLDPKSFEAYRTLGEIELELHNNDAAYRAWIAANKLNPDDAQTAYYLGRLFFEAEFFDEAAVWLRGALRLAPSHFGAMTYLGLCAQHLGDNATATRLYRQAIQQSKLRKTPYAWAYVSYAKLLRQLGEDGEALTLLEESEKICPNAHGLAVLGKLLAERHETARAEAVLRRAIAMDPSISEAHYRLSLLLRSTGRVEEAQSEMGRFQEAKRLEEQTKNSISAFRK